MTKKELLLACLAAAQGGAYEPVQIQKLVFLFQERARGQFRKKPFDFTPYNYGPFDKTIYSELDAMETEGFVQTWAATYKTPRHYDLTEAGKEAGKKALGKLDERYRDYLIKLSAWVRKIPFAELVGAIYKEFPAMKVNSVFRD